MIIPMEVLNVQNNTNVVKMVWPKTEEEKQSVLRAESPRGNGSAISKQKWKRRVPVRRVSVCSTRRLELRVPNVTFDGCRKPSRCV